MQQIDSKIYVNCYHYRSHCKLWIHTQLLTIHDAKYVLQRFRKVGECAKEKSQFYRNGTQNKFVMLTHPLFKFKEYFNYACMTWVDDEPLFFKI